MPSIDERIKSELGTEQSEDRDFFDELLSNMAMDEFERSWKFMMKIIISCIIIFMIIFAWCLINFIYADTVMDKVNWGFWALLIAILAMLAEVIAWIQSNRVATRREIKQLEINMLDAIGRQSQ